MEIKTMIIDLKQKIKSVELETIRLETVAKNLRSQLEATEKVIRCNRDDLTAMRMSVESLEMVGRKEEDRQSQPVRQDPTPVLPASYETREKSRPAPKVNPRKAKKVVQTGPSGKVITVYSSINQCAKALGWTNVGTRKYIESNSPEKQMKLKGFVLKFEN